MNAIHRALALASISLTAACSGTKAAPAPPPPPVVYVSNVSKQDVSLYIDVVGTLDGYVNAEIRARVRGYLRTQDFKDGAFVKKGQSLFTIEDAEFQAATASAVAGVSRARAARDHSQVQLQRDEGLYQAGVGTKQSLDVSSASAADAVGQLSAAEASLQAARLNLSYTKMTSPIDGVAGLASVRVGNLVGQDGPTLLTTVSQIDPIRVNFSISEVDYVKYPARFKNMDLRDLKWAQRQFENLAKSGTTEDGDSGIEITLSDGSTYKHKGVIVTANRQIDATTGTIALQALLPNPDAFLRPGQYGRVRIKRQDEGQNVLVVSEKALIPVQGTYSVAVVGEGNKVQLRRVEVGPAVRGMRVIQSGLKENESVVVEGTQKATDGAVVNPKPAPATVAQAAPSGSAAPSGAKN